MAFCDLIIENVTIIEHNTCTIAVDVHSDSYYHIIMTFTIIIIVIVVYKLHYRYSPGYSVCNGTIQSRVSSKYNASQMMHNSTSLSWTCYCMLPKLTYQYL